MKTKRVEFFKKDGTKMSFKTSTFGVKNPKPKITIKYVKECIMAYEEGYKKAKQEVIKEVSAIWKGQIVKQMGKSSNSDKILVEIIDGGEKDLQDWLNSKEV